MNPKSMVENGLGWVRLGCGCGVEWRQSGEFFGFALGGWAGGLACVGLFRRIFGTNAGLRYD
jgi:hypothetical protein